MRTIKDPRKKPEVRRRTDLDEEQDETDTRSQKSTPPKKRKTTKSSPKDDTVSLNDLGSFTDNQSLVLSEQSSVIGEEDASDVSSLKSTPPKKRNYQKLLNKTPELNGEAHTSTGTPKAKGKKPGKKQESEEVNDGPLNVEDSAKKAAVKGKKKVIKKIIKSEGDIALNEKSAVEPEEKKSAKKRKNDKAKENADTGETNTNSVATPSKKSPGRKRKLSGVQSNNDEKFEKPAGDAVAVNDIKPEDCDAVSKPKKKKKTKKQMLIEEQALELKRQTEEQRNSHADKSNSILPPSINENCNKTPVKAKKKYTPKKKAAKASVPAESVESKNKTTKDDYKSKCVVEKKGIDETQCVVETKGNDKAECSGEKKGTDNICLSEENISAKTDACNARKPSSKPNHAELPFSESEDDLNEEDSSSDLDTSFDSINSARPEDESMDMKKDNNETPEKTVVNNSVNEGKSDIKPEKMMFKCDHCGTVSQSKGGHTRHLRKCLAQQVGPDGEPLNKPPKLHKCEKCEYSAPRRVLVINHMKSHGIFQCKRCMYRTDCEESLDDHSGQEHKDRSDCKFCKLCNRYVKCSEITLEKHMEECQGRVPFKCPECVKEFQYESSLKCHVVSHYPDQPKLFSCDKCDYKSNYKANLKKHVRHIHEERGERSIKCPDCEKLFHTEDNMRRHHKLHSEERPFKCEVEECDKAFKTPNGLKFHMISHQTDRPFACEEEGCGKGFKTKRSLCMHLNETHQNAPKNFACTEEGCDMSFYKKFHLERHMVAHTENRTHFCRWITCTKAFRTAEALKVHNLIHTDEKPVKCDHCEYTCRQRSSIKFHMKKKHPELLPAAAADLAASKAPASETAVKTEGTAENTDTVEPPQDRLKDDQCEVDVKTLTDNGEMSVQNQTRQLDMLESPDAIIDNGNSVSENKTVCAVSPVNDIKDNSSNQKSDSVPSNHVRKETPVKASLIQGKGSDKSVPPTASDTNETPVKKEKKKRTDMYEFQSEDETEDEMKPGLLRKGYDKDKPPLPSVTGTIDPSLLTELNLPQLSDEEPVDTKPAKSVKVKKKPGPKPKSKPPPEPEKVKPEKAETETPQPKKRGRKKKSETEKLFDALAIKETLDVTNEKSKPGRKGRNPKSKKPISPIKKDEAPKEDETPKKNKKVKGNKVLKGNKVSKVAKISKLDKGSEEDEPEKVPVKKKRGPKPKKKLQNETKLEKVPKKRGRKKKVQNEVKEKEEKLEDDDDEEDQKDIDSENGDATINYSEVESEKMFADSKDDSIISDLPDGSSTAHTVIDQSEELSKLIRSNEKFESDKDDKPSDEVDVQSNAGADEDSELLENNAISHDLKELDGDKQFSDSEKQMSDVERTSDVDKKSSDLDSESSDIGSDFEEDLKPPPAPRPPPINDSEDGDIESGPENEDFNASALSNEPLRDFESSREISRDISRDFESSREIDDSVKTSDINSVDTSTPRENEGTPSSVNPYKNDSIENQETPYPQSHHSSIAHTPSHSSIPATPSAGQEYESQGMETRVEDRIMKTQIHGGQTNEENTDESSMPEVDKDYVGRFFEEIQCTQVQAENPISRMNSIEENNKSQEKIAETPQSDSGVPSSMTSNQTEVSLQMQSPIQQMQSPLQSPPADLSLKRMEIIPPAERPREEQYQRRPESVHRPPSERIPSVPTFDPQYTPIDPYASSHPPRDTILRQPDPSKVQSPPHTSPSFMRFPPESEAAMLQRQRMTAPYDRNIQNLHRITDSAIPQHNSSSPLLRHVPGREDVFPGAPGVTSSMSRNPFHSSWSGQEVRPAHWGHPTYLQRPLDQQTASTPSALFGKDSYLPGREFVFDPSRAAERNMFSSLTPSHTQRPDIPHETFQFDRFDLGSYLSSHGYNTAAQTLPVDYTRSAHSTAPKSLDERYRQSSTGVTDFRSLPQTSAASDMFSMNSSFNLDKFYPRDPMYHSQHISDNTNNPFLPGVPSQHSMFSRDYPHRGFYTQNTPYPFVNMNDKNYAGATSAKLAHSSGSVAQQRDLVPVPRPNMGGSEAQLQDPYRHHSSMLYNMMNRYFD